MTAILLSKVVTQTSPFVILPGKPGRNYHTHRLRVPPLEQVLSMKIEKIRCTFHTYSSVLRSIAGTVLLSVCLFPIRVYTGRSNSPDLGVIANTAVHSLLQGVKPSPDPKPLSSVVSRFLVIFSNFLEDSQSQTGNQGV